VLQLVAACRSLLQRIVARCSEWQMCCRCVTDVLQRHKEEASQKLQEAAKTDLEKSKYVLQCVALCCSVLQMCCRCVADVLQM